MSPKPPPRVVKTSPYREDFPMSPARLAGRLIYARQVAVGRTMPGRAMAEEGELFTSFVSPS